MEIWGHRNCILTSPLMPMSHVEFKKYPCHMSLYSLKACRMSIGSMSHVEFKKLPCRPVECKGQGPSWNAIKGLQSHCGYTPLGGRKEGGEGGG